MNVNIFELGKGPRGTFSVARIPCVGEVFCPDCREKTIYVVIGVVHHVTEPGTVDAELHVRSRHADQRLPWYEEPAR